MTLPTSRTVRDELRAIDERLSVPSRALRDDLADTPGDILVLGAGGKMGLSLTRMAVEVSGPGRRVTAVSRFRDPAVRTAFESTGADVVAADLMDGDLARLPDAPNVIHLVGRKFGTTDDQALTWATNAVLPARVARRYGGSRLVVLSTGNVYPLTDVTRGGCDETTPPAPVGEYAQSCLARERVVEHVSRTHGTAAVLLRLNYAVEPRYGVLHDIASAVLAGRPVDVSMGVVNVIWQGDANEVVLRSLQLCTSPPTVLNLTGPETVSVRWLANEFARRFNTRATFTGDEQPTALLSNASRCHARFGYPRVTLGQMIEWTVGWLQAGGPTHDKPTHFAQRRGAY